MIEETDTTAETNGCQLIGKVPTSQCASKTNIWSQKSVMRRGRSGTSAELDHTTELIESWDGPHPVPPHPGPPWGEGELSAVSRTYPRWSLPSQHGLNTRLGAAVPSP